jgi:hypothetical protein
MDELNGEVVCAVEKWCKLLAVLSGAQRARLADTTLHSILQIPSLKMRTMLIRYMVEIFEPTMGSFRVEDQVGEISLGHVDMECILNLDNVGLSAADILAEEGEDIKDRVPPHFLSKSTENIVIDDLIADIIKNKSADDDFLRKVVLVLLGTILAPMHSKIVPKQYYALVADVKRIFKINWNAFTLRILLDCLRLVRKGKHLRQWPKGNLALLQVLLALIYLISLNHCKFIILISLTTIPYVYVVLVLGEGATSGW